MMHELPPPKVGIVAHRGYWDIDGADHNSIASLKNAGVLPVYGSEFDVWLSADDHLIVHHGPRFKMGGPKIEQSDWRIIQQYYLANGENIPTLEQYLQIGRHYTEMKMILEIKRHHSPARSRYAAKKIIDLVEEINMMEHIDFISEDKDVIEELAEFAPNNVRAYVEGGIAPKEAKEFGANAIDYPYKELINQPEWIEQAHELEMTVNCWTVNNDQDLLKLVDLGVDYVTTDKPRIFLSMI